ncbi:MAG: uracil-DNA glycosylase family protein [bacterium]|nr:uracil-DNA glycosylase family protein [bacterium]
MTDTINKIWADLGKLNCGPKLVNQFKLHKFIPNKWFDWDPIGNDKIMIVGQDWGPYVFLKKYVNRYEVENKKSNFNYQEFLFDSFSSRTEKMILRSFEKSYLEKYGKNIETKEWNHFFFTVAVFFCRSGTLFRGNENFDKKGIDLSLPFLKRQINIVKPKIILTLGDMALKQVFNAMDIPIKYKNLTQYINEIQEKKYIIYNGIIIIPSFHPAAHVNPKIIYDRLSLVWEFEK